MNIGKTLESLNSLINKKHRKRVTRHTKFMKQEKRKVVKTFKQDKIYRQQLQNYQEEMFNSTITRSNKKTKNNTTFLDVQNTVVDGDTSSRSILSDSQDQSPVCESENITIIIKKVLIDSTNQPGTTHDGNSSELVGAFSEDSVVFNNYELKFEITERRRKPVTDCLFWQGMKIRIHFKYTLRPQELYIKRTTGW